jgi:hypothetical protein
MRQALAVGGLNPYAKLQSSSYFVTLAQGTADGHRFYVLGHEDGTFSVLDHPHYDAMVVPMSSPRWKIMHNPTSARMIHFPIAGVGLVKREVKDYSFRFMNTQLKMSYAYVPEAELWVVTDPPARVAQYDVLETVKQYAARVIRERELQLQVRIHRPQPYP